jgi:hypothetical protein
MPEKCTISANKYEKYPTINIMDISLNGKLLKELNFLKKREISNPTDTPMKTLKNNNFKKSSKIKKIV